MITTMLFQNQNLIILQKDMFEPYYHFESSHYTAVMWLCFALSYSKPVPQTVKGPSLQRVISRCRVCRKPWQPTDDKRGDN